MSRAADRQAGASRSGEAGLPINAPKAWQIKSLAVRSAQFTSISWTCEGDQVLSGSEDGALRRLDAESGKPDFSCNISSGPTQIECLAAHPTNSRHVAAALNDARGHDNAAVGHFDMRSNKSSSKPDFAHSIGKNVLAMAWHPNGTRLGVSCINGKFSIYDIRKIGSKPRLVVEDKLSWELNNFVFCDKGERIIASYGHKQKGGFKVLQVANLKQLSQAECHIMPCVGLAASADGALLATGGNDATVTVWDTATSSMLHCIYRPDSNCNHVSFSSDGSMLAYSGASDTGRLVSLDIAEHVSKASTPPTIHRMVPDSASVSYAGGSSSSGDFRDCGVAGLSWSPKHPVLAFCGRIGDQSHVACISRVQTAVT